MNIEEFVSNVVTEIRNLLTDEYEVSVNSIPKNNGVILHGVTIREEGTNITPCIYLDQYYSEYTKEANDIPSIAKAVIDLSQKNAIHEEFSVEWFKDFNKVAGKVYGRLVNLDRNQELLLLVPHREFLDLALYYVVDLPEMNGCITIRNEHMLLWGVSEEELYNRFITNISENDQGDISSMASVLGEMIGVDNSEMLSADMRMYILSNQSRHYGAIQLLSKKTLALAAALLDDDFYVLPSSVHETILLPVKDGSSQEVDGLREMVRCVNDTELDASELLSYNVYRFNSNNGSLEIA